MSRRSAQKDLHFFFFLKKALCCVFVLCFILPAQESLVREGNEPVSVAHVELILELHPEEIDRC